MTYVQGDAGFGLYVHWPYCARVCPYCDFNVYAAKNRDSAPLLAAILADISAHRAAFAELARPFDSVFLGGGTPSLLQAAELAAIVSAARSAFGLAHDAEITLEANPLDVLGGDIAGWQAAGVNRLSIGLQALEPAALAFLGRDHCADEGRRAVAAGLSRFANTSIDLIYARPGQTPAQWAGELQAALDLGAPHLSLYELTIAEKTAFGRRAARGELIEMDEDQQATLYELTQDVTAQAGLPAYEISNHAAGKAFRSRHNMIYWAAGDWIGVGPGAHGRLSTQAGRLATCAHRRPHEYIAALQEAPHQPAHAEREPLSGSQAAMEALSLGLRPVQGLELARIAALAGRPLDAAVIDDLQDMGLLDQHDGRIALSAAGRLLADRIAAQLAQVL